MLINTQPNVELQGRLAQLLHLGLIRPIDRAFADFIYAQESSLDEIARESITMLAAHISAQSGAQHSCIELDNLGSVFAGAYYFSDLDLLKTQLNAAHTVVNVDDLVDKSCEIAVKPIIVQNKKAYLHRYWQYEEILASIISEKAAKSIDLDVLYTRQLLAALFPADDDLALDWQKIAVCIAASQSLSFITGGPGTGKTTTVAKLLALLQGLADKKQQVLNIQLVAPTGKAAARLTESILAAKQKLPLALQTNLPEQCQTIHRLLGAKPQSPYFKANKQHPLHLDVLVLDEASMVDLPLMAKLLMALPNHAQVVLLGDHEQLASVETGSVLSDICAASHSTTLPNEPTVHSFSRAMQQQLVQLMSVPEGELNHNDVRSSSVIQDNVVRLVKSHRFSENSGIGKLAKQVKEGQVAACFRLLKDVSNVDLTWFQPQQNSPQAVADEILKSVVATLLPVYREYIQAVHQGDLARAFQSLQQQQVLCAHKKGHWGVEQLNGLIQNELHQQGLIDRNKDFYIGRPVMLTQNDHQLKLFNGDIGIVMGDPIHNNLTKVWFVSPTGEMRGILPSRLPSVSTVFAMTIHKSQGSEFGSVHLCLPPVLADIQSLGLNRELIYTGLTRAKRQFALYAQPKALRCSIEQQCKRGSGLAEKLST